MRSWKKRSEKLKTKSENFAFCFNFGRQTFIVINLKNKSMKTTPIIIITSLVLIFFVACNDDYPTYFVPEEIKQFGYFKKGSWWLYKDEITGQRDCAYVTNVNQYFETETIDKKIQWKKEYFNIGIKHTLPISEYIIVKTDLVEVHYSNTITNSNYIISNILKFNPNLIFQFEYTKINLLSDTIVNGISYNNVYHIVCTAPHSTTQYWLIKGNWLIRRREFWFVNDSIIDFNLINSHIIH